MRWVALLAMAACYHDLSFGGSDASPGSADAAVPVGAPVTAVGVGARFVCALDGSGQIACWGDNGYGQLGNGTTGSAVPTPTVVASPAGPWTELAVGGSHACGLAGGTAYCWGDDTYLQLGSTPGSYAPNPVAGGSDIVQISAGTEISCALDAGSALWCWGQLATLTQYAPLQIANTWTQVSVGDDHACGITTAGDVECFGPCNGGTGSAYCGSPIGSDTPQLYALSITSAAALRVIAGPFETCVIDVDHHLTCSGLFETIPTDTRTWTDVSIGASIGGELQVRCGVADGIARCWGIDELGGLGDGRWLDPDGVTFADSAAVGSASRVAITQPTGEAEQDADEIGCLIDDDARLQCWGGNRSGELGGAPTQQGPTLVAAPDGSGWAHVASSSTHTCATTAAGSLFCWGQNDLGEITGDATSPACPDGICAAPTAAAVTTAPDGLVVGEGFTCVGQGSAVSCWGDNSHGQLGAGGSAEHSPQVTNGLTGLVGGGNDACATSGSGFACWGWYEPENNGPSVFRPTLLAQVADGEIDTPTTIYFAEGSVCSLGNADATSCWGDNSFGERGDGSYGTPSNETPAHATSGTIALAGFFRHYCAVATDAVTDAVTVECWGDDYGDEAGSAEDTASLVPTPQPVDDAFGEELRNCTAVATGLDFSCAVCAGSVDCWGFSYFGALGETGLAIEVGSAVDVAAPIGSAAALVGAGIHRDDHTCALDGAGALACWGYGPRGELGLGSDVHGSALPVAVAVP